VQEHGIKGLALAIPQEQSKPIIGKNASNDPLKPYSTVSIGKKKRQQLPGAFS
jgi:hypothetical protein